MEKQNVIDPYMQLHSLDKEITSLEKQIWNYFIDNVGEEDKKGEVTLPLVNSSSLDADSSEYVKLRYYTNEIKLKINQINQEFKKIDYYEKQIRSELIGSGLNEDMVEEEVKRKVNLLRKEFLNHITNLKNRLALINEDQKAYLRFKDCQESNFEMVKDKEAKSKLRKMKKELSEKKQERNVISKAIKSTLDIDETKEKDSRFSLKLLFPKNKKRS